MPEIAMGSSSSGSSAATAGAEQIVSVSDDASLIRWQEAEGKGMDGHGAWSQVTAVHPPIAALTALFW